MAIVVGENSYLTVERAREIADADFIVEQLGMSDAAAEISLINATNIVDTLFKFKYSKLDEAQLLEFPRVNLTTLVEYPINFDIELITTRICYFLKMDPSMFEKTSSKTNQQIKKEKMDVFETEYYKDESETSIEFIYLLDIHTRKLLEKYILDTSVKSQVVGIITR